MNFTLKERIPVVNLSWGHHQTPKLQEDCHSLKLKNYCQVSKLTDDVVLMIFSLLDIKSLVTVSRVCKRWLQLSRRPCLWSVIDLRENRELCSLQTLKTLAKSRFTESLKELYLDAEPSPDFSSSLVFSFGFSKPCLTVEFLKGLSQKCPHLNVIYLNCFKLDTSKHDITLLPPKVTEITLRDCNLSRCWFSDLYRYKSLMNSLKYVDISQSEGIYDRTLKALSNCAKLKTLKIATCSNLSCSAIENFITAVPSLTHLDVSYCRVSNSTLSHVGNYLKQLRVLYICRCSAVTNSGVRDLLQKIPGITHLDLSYCCGITKDVIKPIMEYCKNLQWLGLLSCDITPQEEETIKLMLPNCKTFTSVYVAGVGL